MLWEKDFTHIAFATVDDFSEERGTFVPATQEDFVKGLEFRGFGDDSVKERPDEEKSESSQALLVEGLRQALNPSPGQSLVQACQLTPDEMEAIQLEVQQEQQPEYLYALINNLIEILLHLGEDMDAYENMISYFDRVIASLFEQKEIRKAVAILKNFSDTMESMVLKDKQIFAIHRILEKSSSPHSIKLLGKAMKGNGEVESEAIHQYLQLLTKQAIDPLCKLLKELESGKWRKTVCDQLVELSREEIQPLIKYLSDPNPFLVSHMLYILGKTGHPSTVKYLGGLVNHEDLKVREETLQVLNKFGEKGKDLVQKFLTDSVPGIRAKAALSLARMIKEKAVKPLNGRFNKE